MYFLIGLGIILVIVYGNSLYDYLREKKAKQENGEVRAAGSAESVGSRLTKALEISETSETVSGIILSEVIEEKLKSGQNIFGLPLKLCEKDENGKLVALDREDNIYVIETSLRSEFEDFYEQAQADMQAEKRRIPKKSSDRRVYGIVCVSQPSELLMAAAEKESGLRIYRYDVTFENIL